MKTIPLILAVSFLALLGCGQSQNNDEPNLIVCNPLELNYRFQPEEMSRREAADPVCIYFKDAYYLFASKSGGYWRSEDLAKWNYIPCQTIPIIMDYAPTIMEYKGELYFTASSDGRPTRFFKNAHPERDEWTEIPTKFTLPGQHDPAFFKDEDGRVYLFWGCHDVDPIVGVEVDPEDGFAPKGEPVAIIEHKYKEYGWEVPGDWYDNDVAGWNEGPAVLKHNGKYYLQYAAPGTQFRTYGDGYYVADSPLGPYTYAEESPFSIKTGGFIGGAGHGDTFRDKYGNLWHVATMKVSVRHWFERRIGLFPVTISEKYGMYAHQDFGDYPFVIPNKKVDEQHDWRLDGYNLLSLNKAVTVSSALEGYEPEKAADETVETWWSACSGEAGEWLAIDLGKEETVRAVQVNFADQDFQVWAPHGDVVYQYLIETSADGEAWQVAVDMTKNTVDAPHRLHNFDTPISARYVRISNQASIADGKFSLYDLRVFGGEGRMETPAPNMKVERNASDARRYTVTWDAVPQATGYIVRWGTHPEKLTHSSTVFDTCYEAGHYNVGSEYFFEVMAF